MPTQEKEHILEKPKFEQKDINLRSQSSRQISTKISGLTFPWTKVLYVSLGLVGTGLLGFGLYEVGKRLFGKPKGWYVTNINGEPPLHVDYKDKNFNHKEAKFGRFHPKNRWLFIPFPDEFPLKIEAEYWDYKGSDNKGFNNIKIEYKCSKEDKNYKWEPVNNNDKNNKLFFNPVY
ncbi:hypothetical protein QLQ80_01810 [Mycoplasma sp. M5725]|uniref:Uncharacterized protein n=1 Tax=Mycoplasma phocimorsus TaxID=3045839 RepID=A0AAJ1UZK2_9MOLU|nr:hypothetical protein [Mycoplasma phocimorsus]MDJ1645823.1 hypothetical protein [Mycoplasma phocimorsus]